MFGIMFGAFLRIGEVTASPHNLQFHQVQLSEKSVTITFHTYKHHDPSQPVSLSLPIAPGSPACPVHVITRYISLRGRRQGPLFCDQDYSPILSGTFREVLMQVKRSTAICTSYTLLPTVSALERPPSRQLRAIQRSRSRLWAVGNPRPSRDMSVCLPSNSLTH